jgi:peroxiredoxin
MELTNNRQPAPTLSLSSNKVASFADKTAVLVLFALSIALNFFLIARLHQATQRPTAHPLLTAGTSMPSIEAQTVDGTPGTIEYASASVPTVLYVFTPQCGWCKRNLPDLHALAGQAGNKYRLIGISLNDRDLKQYIATQHLDFPVYTHLSDSALSAYQLGSTPTTIVISPQGKILDSWVGVYGDDIKSKIESSLNVSLPGCCKS